MHFLRHETVTLKLICANDVRQPPDHLCVHTQTPSQSCQQLKSQATVNNPSKLTLYPKMQLALALVQKSFIFLECSIHHRKIPLASTFPKGNSFSQIHEEKINTRSCLDAKIFGCKILQQFRLYLVIIVLLWINQAQKIRLANYSQTV